MSIEKKLRRVIGNARRVIAADKAGDHDLDRHAARSLVLIAVCIAASAPGIAFAGGASGPWDTMGAQVLAIFTGGLTRTIAIISVIACGIAALAGKLSWDWAIKIIVGIVLIFGGAAIVDYLIAAAS
jgi:type IV secretion system protein VirB2